MPEGKPTPQQEKYYALCLHFIDTQLPAFMSDVIFNKDTGSSFDNAVNNASNIVTATTGIASIAAAGMAFATAPLSFGATLPLIPLILSVLPAAKEGGRSFQKIVRAISDEKNQTSVIGEMYGDLFRAYQSLLTRVAYICSHRYAEPLKQRCEEQGITEFAHFTIQYLIKKLAKAIRKNVCKYNQLPSPETVANWLLESKHISILHQPQEISLKPEYRIVSRLAKAPSYAKWLASRALIAEITMEAGKPQLRYYGSLSEKVYSQPTTLSSYGMITLPYPKHPELITQTTLAIIEDEASINDFTTNIVPELSIFYTVTCEDMHAYLDMQRTTNNRQTLNAYLSKKFDLNIVAECHDNRFKGENLSYGDFSHAYFDGITFENCNLNETLFEKTRLYQATFLRSSINNACFSHCYAIETRWEHIVFSGTFSQVNFAGATIDNCEYHNVFLHCNFEDVILGIIHMPGQATLNNIIVDNTNESKPQPDVDISNFTPTLRPSISTTSLPEQLIIATENIECQQLYRQLHTISAANHYDRTYQTHKKNLITLSVQSANPANPTCLPLSDALENFYEDNETQFKLVTGRRGSGKTFSATLWLEELQLQFQHENAWLPIPIKLTEAISNTRSNFLLACLDSLGFNSAIKERIFQSNVFFIIDGLHELPDNAERYIIEECRQLNALWIRNGKKLPKFLFFAESNALYDRDYRTWLGHDENTPFSLNDELIIQPLTKKQIDQYISYFINEYPSFQTQYDTFRAQEKKTEEYPLSLHILCTILSQDTNAILSSRRFEFYQAFQDLWFKHIVKQASNSTITLEKLIDYDNRVALELFKIKMPYIERNPNEIDTLFSNKENIKTHYLCPYSITRTRNRHNESISRITYTNDTFRCYSLARALIDLLFSDKTYAEKMQIWGEDTLRNNPDTLAFIRDYYTTRISRVDEKKRARIEETLIQMINASKKDKSSPLHYASNAITVLNFAFTFSTKLPRDALIGIRVPNAILSGGRFEYMYLTQGNFVNVDFTGATLINTDFSNSNIDGVSFLAATDALFTGETVNMVAVRPAQGFTVAYATGQNIVIENTKQRYVSTNAHLNPITALVWGVRDDEHRTEIIVSASNSTARVWHVGTNGNLSPLCKLKHSPESKILSIALSPNGHYLATTHQNGNFLLWNISEASIVFTYHSNDITHENHIIWSKNRREVLLACNSGSIRYWEITWSSGNKLNIANENPNYFQTISEENAYSSEGSGAITAIDTGQIETSCRQDYLTVSYGDACFYIYDINRPASIFSKRISGHRAPITALACQGNMIVSASKDYSVKLWSMHTITQDNTTEFMAELMATYFNHSYPVDCLRWYHDSRTFLSNGIENMLLIHDAHHASPPSPETLFHSPLAQLTNKNDTTLLCYESNGKVWVFDIPILTCEYVKTLDKPLPSELPESLFSLLNEKKYRYTEYTVKQHARNELYLAIVDAQDKVFIYHNITKEFLVEVESHNKPTTITWALRDTNQCLIIGSRSCIEIWDIQKSPSKQTVNVILFSTLPYPATQLVFCSSYLCVAHDRTILLLNLEKINTKSAYSPIEHQIGARTTTALTGTNITDAINCSSRNDALVKHYNPNTTHGKKTSSDSSWLDRFFPSTTTHTPKTPELRLSPLPPPLFAKDASTNSFSSGTGSSSHHSTRRPILYDHRLYGYGTHTPSPTSHLATSSSNSNNNSNGNSDNEENSSEIGEYSPYSL